MVMVREIAAWHCVTLRQHRHQLPPFFGPPLVLSLVLSRSSPWKAALASGGAPTASRLNSFRAPGDQVLPFHHLSDDLIEAVLAKHLLTTSKAESDALRSCLIVTAPSMAASVLGRSNPWTLQGSQALGAAAWLVRHRPQMLLQTLPGANEGQARTVVVREAQLSAGQVLPGLMPLIREAGVTSVELGEGWAEPGLLCDPSALSSILFALGPCLTSLDLRRPAGHKVQVPDLLSIISLLASNPAAFPALSSLALTLEASADLAPLADALASLSSLPALSSLKTTWGRMTDSQPPPVNSLSAPEDVFSSAALLLGNPAARQSELVQLATLDYLVEAFQLRYFGPSAIPVLSCLLRLDAPPAVLRRIAAVLASLHLLRGTLGMFWEYHFVGFFRSLCEDDCLVRIVEIALRERGLPEDLRMAYADAMAWLLSETNTDMWLEPMDYGIQIWRQFEALSRSEDIARQAKFLRFAHIILSTSNSIDYGQGTLNTAFHYAISKLLPHAWIGPMIGPMGVKALPSAVHLAAKFLDAVAAGRRDCAEPGAGLTYDPSDPKTFDTAVTARILHLLSVPEVARAAVGDHPVRNAWFNIYKIWVDSVFPLPVPGPDGESEAAAPLYGAETLDRLALLIEMFDDFQSRPSESSYTTLFDPKPSNLTEALPSWRTRDFNKRIQALLVFITSILEAPPSAADIAPLTPGLFRLLRHLHGIVVFEGSRNTKYFSAVFRRVLNLCLRYMSDTAAPALSLEAASHASLIVEALIAADPEASARWPEPDETLASKRKVSGMEPAVLLQAFMPALNGVRAASEAQGWPTKNAAQVFNPLLHVFCTLVAPIRLLDPGLDPRAEIPLGPMPPAALAALFATWQPQQDLSRAAVKIGTCRTLTWAHAVGRVAGDRHCGAAFLADGQALLAAVCRRLVSLLSTDFRCSLFREGTRDEADIAKALARLVQSRPEAGRILASEGILGALLESSWTLGALLISFPAIQTYADRAARSIEVLCGIVKDSDSVNSLMSHSGAVSVSRRRHPYSFRKLVERLAFAALDPLDTSYIGTGGLKRPVDDLRHQATCLLMQLLTGPNATGASLAVESVSKALAAAASAASHVQSGSAPRRPPRLYEYDGYGSDSAAVAGPPIENLGLLACISAVYRVEQQARAAMMLSSREEYERILRKAIEKSRAQEG